MGPDHERERCAAQLPAGGAAVPVLPPSALTWRTTVVEGAALMSFLAALVAFAEPDIAAWLRGEPPVPASAQKDCR